MYACKHVVCISYFSVTTLVFLEIACLFWYKLKIIINDLRSVYTGMKYNYNK